MGTLKDALGKWQAAHPDTKLENALEVGLQFHYPPIEKMDNALAVLKKCEKLSLSTNIIDKISGLQVLKNLKILSLSRNYIKTFAGLDAVAGTLEQLWISYNNIEKTRGIDNLKKLKVLYVAYNNIKKWDEFERFCNLPLLEDFIFIGNPLYDTIDPAKYTKEITKRIPTLKVLEGVPVVGDDESDDD